MVGLQVLILTIGVRIPASEQIKKSANAGFFICEDERYNF
jgi:hypothetical protein